MARIFVSYRREDGIAQTGRVYDRLVGTFGDAEVFMDLGKISPGVDFTQVLDEKLEACEIFVAVIGPRWLISRKGRKRLEDPDDFVRREIATALRRGVRILPVLIGDARMPQPVELPSELAEFSKRNAVKIRDERFDAVMDSLLLDIEEPDRPPEDTLLRRMQEMRARMRQRRDAILIGTAIVLGLAAASWSDLFDLLALDTRLSTLTLSLGELYQQHPPDERVVIVGIDTATEAALGERFDRNWRRHHAMLLENLAAAQARAVAFDMYFEEPTAHDTGFLDALRYARDAGVAVYVGGRRAGDTGTIPALREAVTATGNLCVGHRLGYATTAPLWTARRDQAGNGESWQSRRIGLGMLAAFGPAQAAVPDRTERTLLVPTGHIVQEVDIGAFERVKSPQTACPGVGIGDESADLFIQLSAAHHWRSAPRYIKYESILDAGKPFASSTLAAALRGKTVLVGVTGASQSTDRHVVTYRFASEARHGVELHADVVSNLLAGRQVHPLHWGGQLLMTILTVAMAGAVRLVTGGLHRTIRWAAIAIAVVLYLWLAGYLCAHHQLLLNGVYHLAGFGLAYWLMGRMRATGRLARDAAMGG